MTTTKRPIGDLAKGMAAISEHLGVTRRQGFHLHEQKLIPAFHVGKGVCARRSDLDRWLEDQARGARAANHG